jgi:hypothetical protein
MESNLAGKPLIEVEEIAERAISSGASSEFTIKSLSERGVSADLARQIVASAVQKVSRLRELKAEDAADEYRSVKRLSTTWILIGCCFIAAGYFTSGYLCLIGLFFAYIGVRILWTWHLRN